MAGRPLRRARNAAKRNGGSFFRWRRNGEGAASIHELDGDLWSKRNGRGRRRRNRDPMPDVIPMATYAGIMGDYDGDGILDADDPHPYQPGDTQTIEEVSIADEIRQLNEAREPFVEAKTDVMSRLRTIGVPGKVEGRVKSPYSIINKLRRKRLFGPKGLTDLAATRIIVRTADEAKRAVRVLAGGAVGGVIEIEDFYTKPNDGYRAYHLIVTLPKYGPEGEIELVPVEVQVKTERMSKVSEASHKPYKDGTLDKQVMEEVTRLADAADRGDARAAKAFDRVASDKDRLQRRLTAS